MFLTKFGLKSEGLDRPSVGWCGVVWSGVQHLVEQFEDCAHELCPALLRVHGSDLGAGRKCREVQERCRGLFTEVQG